MQLTDQQRKALHKGFELIAESLNDAGLDKQAVFRVKRVSVPWTKEGVKEDLWRDIQKAMYGTRSTNDLNRTEVGDVWDVLLRHLGGELGVPYIPFPHEEDKEANPDNHHKQQSLS